MTARVRALFSVDVVEQYGFARLGFRGESDLLEERSDSRRRLAAFGPLRGRSIQAADEQKEHERSTNQEESFRHCHSQPLSAVRAIDWRDPERRVL
jgi:hypothetical protein